MKQKYATFTSLFVVLEALIMLSVWSSLKGELWYYKILLIILYTFFTFEFSCALMNILFVQYISRLKKEVGTLFLFEKEKLILKWIMLGCSLVIFLCALYLNHSFLGLLLIITAGYSNLKEAAIYVKGEKIIYIDSYLTNVKEVADMFIVDNKLNFILNNKNIVIEVKNKMELDRLKSILNE